MKFVSFLKDGEERLGLYIDGKIADLAAEAKAHDLKIPSTMSEFLNAGVKAMNDAHKIADLLQGGFKAVNVNKILSPVPKPTSCRDAYAFRQHVASARRNRGVDMIPEFDQFPIFYFTNHNAVYGEGEIEIENDHLHKLDFELEWAVVIGKAGRNVKSKDADEYIAGFTIMNDLSARRLQMEEMRLNLGPAKGKDFATTTGPWLVTPDELEDFKIETEFGNQYDLSMKAWHNGKQVSEGNTKDMTWTFAEIIERVSYGVDIHPGDVIGSGTVGTGCYLELNGTWTREAKERGEEHTPVWLEDGDEITLEVSGLGTLKNTIKLTDNDTSILAKKKNI
jgi:fumarylacetoacetate (FAA) hydrolase